VTDRDPAREAAGRLRAVILGLRPSKPQPGWPGLAGVAAETWTLAERLLPPRMRAAIEADGGAEAWAAARLRTEAAEARLAAIGAEPAPARGRRR
jgi:hypothetical protein